MKDKLIRFMKKAAVDSVELSASYFFWGEKEIPKAILDEIKAKKSK